MGWLRAGTVGLALVGCAAEERGDRDRVRPDAPIDEALVPPTASSGQDVEAVAPELPDVIDLGLLGIVQPTGVAVDQFLGTIYVVEGSGALHEVDRRGEWASWVDAGIPGTPWVRDLTWAHGQGTHLFLLTDVGGFRLDTGFATPTEEWFCLEPEDGPWEEEGVLGYDEPCQAGGAVAFQGQGTRELFTVHQVVDCNSPWQVLDSHIEIYDVDTGVIEEIWLGTEPLQAVGAVSLRGVPGGVWDRTWLVAEPSGFRTVTLDAPPFRPQAEPFGLPTDFDRIEGIALSAEGDALWVLDGRARELRRIAL